jgi:hypothetical protein
VGLRRTLTFFLESQFALLVVVLVLSSTTILASLCANLSVVVRRQELEVVAMCTYLSLILRHIDCCSLLFLVVLLGSKMRLPRVFPVG